MLDFQDIKRRIDLVPDEMIFRFQDIFYGWEWSRIDPSVRKRMEGEFLSGAYVFGVKGWGVTKQNQILYRKV